MPVHLVPPFEHGSLCGAEVPCTDPGALYARQGTAVTGVVSAGGLGRVTKLYGRWGEVEEAEKEEVAEIRVDLSLIHI